MAVRTVGGSCASSAAHDLARGCAAGSCFWEEMSHLWGVGVRAGAGMRALLYDDVRAMLAWLSDHQHQPAAREGWRSAVLLNRPVFYIHPNYDPATPPPPPPTY